MAAQLRRFYEEQFRGERYAVGVVERGERPSLDAFVKAHGLERRRLLEVGSGRGAFQDLVPAWVGVDLAVAAGAFTRKPFAAASAAALPFRAKSFDAVFSVTVLEHVPDPERALEEIARVLKPGGLAYLAPAWHCRPWAARGLHLRPWSDLGFGDSLVKSTIPLRESLVFRAACALPVRVLREVALRRGGPLAFRYRQLRPNYDVFWCADSDACNAMDPHEMLLWFLSRGFTSPSHPSPKARLLTRHGAIVVRKPEPAA